MTNISVRRSDIHVSNRAWLRGPHGTEPGAMPSVTVDVSAFPAQDTGFIPSGTVVSKLASGLYGPFDDELDSHGILFEHVVTKDGDAGTAILIHGFVDADKLPDGSPALADLKAALPHIIFD